MKTIQIIVPDLLEKMLKKNKRETKKLFFKKLAFMLYAYIDEGLISHKEAANILKIPKDNLLDFYEEYGLPYVKYTQKEFNEDKKVFDFLDKKKGITK